MKNYVHFFNFNSSRGVVSTRLRNYRAFKYRVKKIALYYQFTIFDYE